MNLRLSESTSIRRGRTLRGATAVVMALATAAIISSCGSSSSSSSSTAAKTNLNTPHVERAIERSILSERHVHATVICPKVVPQEKGHNFTCIARVGKKTTPFTVVQQNNSGYVTYQAK
ncbi:MAG: hypothetical protein WB709_04680 [Solirubrobacteraceae bacterium]